MASSVILVEISLSVLFVDCVGAVCSACCPCATYRHTHATIAATALQRQLMHPSTLEIIVSQLSEYHGRQNILTVFLVKLPGISPFPISTDSATLRFPFQRGKSDKCDRTNRCFCSPHFCCASLSPPSPLTRKPKTSKLKKSPPTSRPSPRSRISTTPCTSASATRDSRTRT